MKVSKQFLLDSMRCAFCLGCCRMVWHLAPHPMKAYCPYCAKAYAHADTRTLILPSAWLGFEEFPTGKWGTSWSHRYIIKTIGEVRKSAETYCVDTPNTCFPGRQ